MSSLKKNFGYQIAYRILTIVTPLITFPIVTRALGPDNLGLFSATNAFAHYFVFLAMLGIEKYGMRTIAALKSKAEKQKLFWEIYSVQISSSVLAIFIYSIYTICAGGSRSFLMALQGLWILSCSFNINWFFWGIENFKITVIRNFIVKFVSVIAIILFVKQPSDLNLYTFIMSGSFVASESILWVALVKHIKFEKVYWQNIKVHILPILRLFVPMIAFSIYHLMDKTMLDMFSSEANVGWYYAVDKIVYIPLGVILALGTVMITRMSYVLHNETRAKADTLISKSSELIMFLTCAVAFGIAAISEEFIPFFFGPGYEPCVKLMYIFLPVLIIKAWSDIVRTQYLIPAKKDNVYLAGAVGGAVTNAIFNLFLIPLWGAKGAVCGTLAAEFVALVIQIAGCGKEVNFIKVFAKQFFYMIIGGVMIVAVRMCAGTMEFAVFYKIVLLIIIGAFVYMSQCGIVWLFKKDSVFYGYTRKLIKR